MPRKKSILQALKYHKCSVEDKHIIYEGKDGAKVWFHEMTPEQFAIWELGFADGHSCGMQRLQDDMGELKTNYTRKELRAIYG